MYDVSPDFADAYGGMFLDETYAAFLGESNDSETELHRFYLYDKRHEENRLNPFLYAYTKDAELSAGFMQSRNSNLFIYKHSIEPYRAIADIEHRHPSTRLRKTKLKSRSPEDPTKTIDVPIILTCDEEIKVISAHDDLYNIIGMGRCMEDMTVLSTGLNLALKDLGYFDIYRYMSQMQYIDSDPSYFYAGVGMSPAVLASIVPDEFSIFMLLFGNTLKV